MDGKIKFGLAMLVLAVMVSGSLLSVSMTQAEPAEQVDIQDTDSGEDAERYARCGGIQDCRSNCGCGCGGNPSACGCGG